LDYESPSENYEINSFSQGLHIDYSNGHSVKRFFGVEKDIKPVKDFETITPNNTPLLPPQNTWINIKDLGAKGDGVTDDTDVFKKAIEKYDAIFIPMGKYLISSTLKLKENTKLIGFHPYMTQIFLKDGTPEFLHFDDSKALIETPHNGVNGIIGLGFDLGINPGAVGIKWMAGSNSYIDDINFRNLGEKSVRGEGQAGSLWISNGGTGTFKNIWIVDSRAQLPFYVSNTEEPGKIYYMSVEHHRDIEVKIDNVKNWTFFALQMEEDRGSEKALGMYLKDCRNLLFANLRSHRTSGVWEPYLSGIQIRNSRDITIRGNNMSGFVFPWDNAVFDEITGRTIQHKLFSKMVIK
jgi:polygalacturonase